MNAVPTDLAKAETGGASWIGTVPRDWDIVLLRLVARIESGHTPSRNHPEYWIPDECIIPWFSLADIWQLRDGTQKYLSHTTERISDLGMRNSAARLLPAATVVLSRTASVGFSGIMPKPMATTQDFVNWICGPRILPDYLLWIFRAMRTELKRLMMGSTHQTIYMPDIRQFRTPLPPLHDQQAIADYLDEKTAAVDALIEKKRKLLDLLAEERAALINHVVTKGLDPTVPMKDSGIPWIGEIPAHWSIQQVRRIVRKIEQGWSPLCDNREADADAWGVLKVGCVNGGVFKEFEHKALSEGMAPVESLEIRQGDLLTNKGKSPGSAGETVAV